MAESEEELKSLLMKVRREWKVGLKLNTQKTEIMASGPITSWQIDGEKMETVMDFIFLASKITMDVDYSHETKNTFSFKEKQCQTSRAYEKAEIILGLQRSVQSKQCFFQ